MEFLSRAAPRMAFMLVPMRGRGSREYGYADAEPRLGQHQPTKGMLMVFVAVTVGDGAWKILRSRSVEARTMQ